MAKSKCRKCRQGKRNMEASPKRPPRGSIRKRKREAMRAAKNAATRKETA